MAPHIDWLYASACTTGARAFHEKKGFEIVARGFEPTSPLAHIKYEWVAERALGKYSPLFTEERS